MDNKLSKKYIKLGLLPSDIGNKIIPEMDYVIKMIKESTQGPNEEDAKDIHFMSKADFDNMSDKDYENLKNTYAMIDQMFSSLKSANPDLYKKVLDSMNKY